MSTSDIVQTRTYQHQCVVAIRKSAGYYCLSTDFAIEAFNILVYHQNIYSGKKKTETEGFLRFGNCINYRFSKSFNTVCGKEFACAIMAMDT